METNIREMTQEQFLELFDKSIRETILNKIKEFEALGAVCFENQQLDSSHVGERTALIVGPKNTYKSVDDCRGRHLGELPSIFQYPIAFFYADKEKVSRKPCGHATVEHCRCTSK